jgi:hypothetical protein
MLKFFIPLVFSFAWAGPKSEAPPAIASLLRPEVYKRVIHDQEVMTHASLDPIKGSKMKHYHYYGAMLAHASVEQTRKVLTDYPTFAKIIPYVDKAEFDAENKSLWIEGGIFNFKIGSRVQFKDKGDRWIGYTITEGSFKGLVGDVFFEALSDKGSLVFLRGDLTAENWPPGFVIERGAEIVFGVAGQKLKSQIESRKMDGPGMTPAPGGSALPTPLKSLQRPQ